MQWGHEKIRANMYVVLVGPSGQTRKGTPIGIVRDLLTEVGVKLASNAGSRQSLISYMGDSLDSYTDPDSGELIYHCSVTCLSEEMSVFLGQQDIERLADLTDLYDAKDEWSYSTRKHGIESVRGVCVNMLAGTAATWLPSILPQEAIGGGFTSRLIFVVEQYKGQVVSDPNSVPPDAGLRDALIHDLREIINLSGQFTFDTAALKLYKEWYERQERNIKNNCPAIADPRFGGYMARRASHIKKLAMIMSTSRGDDRTVTLADFKRAQLILETAEKKMPGAFKGLGTARFAVVTENILDFINTRGKVKRSQVLQLFWRDCDAWTMDQVEAVLGRMKAIRISLISGLDDKEYESLAAEVIDRHGKLIGDS